MSTSQREAWERYGRENPYYSVLTWSAYRGRTPAGASREAFFRSGEEDAERMMALVRKHLNKPRRFHRLLDFGCGVGRMTLPLAAHAERVVGVDVSAAMCAEGARNRDAVGISNVVFTLPEHGLDPELPPYDLIHSYIVFQHIPVKQGLVTLERLLDCLKPGGVAVLHFTCVDPRSPWRTRISQMLRGLPLVRNILNRLNGRSFFEPVTQMNAYPFGEIMVRLHHHGIKQLSCELTDHGGWQGVVLCFVKPVPAGWAPGKAVKAAEKATASPTKSGR